MSHSELAVEQPARQPVVRHSNNMPQPSQLSLEEQVFSRSYSSFLEELSVWYFLPPPQPLPYFMPIPPNTLYNKKFIARTWQHFIDLLKRKNHRFTAFLDSNAYIKLGAGPVRRLPPALGTGQVMACGHAPPCASL